MGVYIKGVTKQELKDIFGKACILYNSADLVEVKTPHGRLIDAEVCKKRVYDGSRTPYNVCPTVIEAEVE